MSTARRTRRAQEAETSKHFEVLLELLGGYYEFLERKPKPSDSEVREEFIKRDKSWKRYCSFNHLNDRATLLFNQEVGLSWKNRYAKQNSQTQN